MSLCPACNREFDPDVRATSNPHPQYANPRTYVYCSQKCARRTQSRKYYAAHRNKVKERIKQKKRI